MRESILAKGRRRLLAAMLERGLPVKLADHRPYGTMRSAWVATFPKHRGRAFLASDTADKLWGIGDDLEYFDLGGEG